MSAWRRFLNKLGPGLITGAADDDPSGIATYSQGGAMFGFGTLWALVFTYPLMVAIQTASARIGLVTGRGLAANLRRAYPAWLMHFVVYALLFANTLNIGADLAAMGQAMALLRLGPGELWAVFFGLFTLSLQILFPYQRYVRWLKFLTLGLLAYVGTVLVVNVPWLTVLREVVWPPLRFNRDYVLTVVAILGTTISPYLFFWQAAQEVEELRTRRRGLGLRRRPLDADEELHRVRVDTSFGMGFSNLVAFFIMVTTGTVLHAHGVTDITTTRQAATALRPLAGDAAYLLFSLGIIGTGLLAVPVLSGSAAYAWAESLGLPAGLDHRIDAAKGYYGVMAVAVAIGVLINFTPLHPIQALYYSAVVNGIVSVPIMAVIMHMVSRRKLMGRFVVSRRLRVLGWLATGVMALAVAILFWSLLTG